MDQKANSFVKTLKKNDIEQRLAVPTEFVICNGLVNGQELKVVDLDSGIVYQFVLSIRDGDYMKPVFQARGWGKFARQDYDLIPGDTIHFWKHDHQSFRIRLMRDFLSRSAAPN